MIVSGIPLEIPRQRRFLGSLFSVMQPARSFPGTTFIANLECGMEVSFPSSSVWCVRTRLCSCWRVSSSKTLGNSQSVYHFWTRTRHAYERNFLQLFNYAKMFFCKKLFIVDANYFQVATIFLHVLFYVSYFKQIN